MAKIINWLEKGRDFYDKRRFYDAIKCFDKGIELNAKDSSLWHYKGIAWIDLDHYEEAIECFDKMIELNSKNAFVWHNKGCVLYKLKRNEEAIECFNKAIELNPDDFSAWYSKGITLNGLQRYEVAIECFNKAIELNPEYLDTWLNKGYSLCNLKRYEEAVECIDKAIELNPESDTWYNKGHILNKLKHYEEAIKCFDKTIELNSENSDAWYSRGFALNELKYFEDAIECYNKAIELNPKSSNAWNNKGSILYESKHYKEAIECYDRAISLNPASIPSWTNKGFALNGLKYYKEAIGCFDKVIELSPESTLAWNDKGIALIGLNRYNEAVECFRKAGKDVLDVIVLDMKNGEKAAAVMLDNDSFFIDTIGNQVNEKNKEVYKKIYIRSLQIIKQLHVTNDNEKQVAHYTKKSISEKLLFDKPNDKTTDEDKDGMGQLRLFSSVTTNDPKEGKTLLDYLKFTKDLSSEEDNHRAFMGCFAFNHQHLNQFRLYGKEDSREATGVSLVFKESFFSRNIKRNTQLISASLNPNSSNDNSLVPEQEQNEQPLFRCIYLDPETGYIASVGHKEEHTFYRENSVEADKNVAEYKRYINGVLKNVRNGFKELKVKIYNRSPEEKKIIANLLVNLRYLTKHIAFKEEQECRIIKIESLLISKDIKIDSDYRQMYINYKVKVKEHVEKVCFAPKTDGLELYMDILKNKRLGHIQCERCDHPFA